MCEGEGSVKGERGEKGGKGGEEKKKGGKREFSS